MARERRSSQDIANAALFDIYQKYQIPAEQKEVKAEGRKTAVELLANVVPYAYINSVIENGARTY